MGILDRLSLATLAVATPFMVWCAWYWADRGAWIRMTGASIFAVVMAAEVYALAIHQEEDR